MGIFSKLFGGTAAGGALFQMYKAQAEQGFANAQCTLGMMYSIGNDVPQDYAEAAYWFRKAAEQDEPFAQYSLGAMYSSGQGVSQDTAQSLMWIRKAADQAVADAQFFLGNAYLNGLTGAQDYVQAMKWYLIAKACGSTLADHNLQRLESLLTSAQIAEAQRLARESLLNPEMRNALLRPTC